MDVVTPAPHTSLCKSGVERIAAERQRQVDAEGWTPEHDDRHDRMELRAAAFGYLGAVRCDQAVPMGWPFEPEAWKPSDDSVRNLARAGALIAAEIDRILRSTGEMTA
jgi:hypothetical protein